MKKDLSRKTVYSRAIDNIVAWFVPTTMLIALLTGFSTFFFGDGSIETAVLRAMAVLLIACPCAIGIASPLAEARLLDALSHLGAIVRNRGCLPRLGNETVMVFDKTGTITEGYFHVLSGLENLEPTDLAILKTLGEHSTHLIANAIARSISEAALPNLQIEEVSGKGMRATSEHDTYFLGSEDFMAQHNISITPTISSNTPVYYAKNSQLVSTLILGDRIRPQAAETVNQLGSTHTLLLSGDAEAPVVLTAKACAFKEWKWRQSPLQKREYIDALKQKGEVVTMLGDGINDALALAGADVGISVVTATDVSIQVSDILLTTDQLGVLPRMRKLARLGQKIIKQNLFWAFFYNIIGIGLAVCGLLTPLFAAAAMVLSSLMVILNTQRVRCG